jgi:hypothetical protein
MQRANLTGRAIAQNTEKLPLIHQQLELDADAAAIHRRVRTLTSFDSVIQ